MSSGTIAALSTPPGMSGLAVVRLSGEACPSVLRLCLGREWQIPSDSNPAGAAGLRAAKPRYMHTGPFRHPRSGAILDRLNFVAYQGPQSPTGEDMLEIFPHGNPLLIENLLQALLLVPGVRLAEPGEFTRRACENGKLDLVQAEGLMALVHAQSQAALQHAGRILDGALSRRLKALRQNLIDLLVRLELDVDFVEEEADPDYASWRPRIQAVLDEIDALLRTHARGSQLNRVPRVVLVGSPNAGKSSLINALLREERLLVSERPGTTRDFVEVPLHLPSGLVHLVDTAGLGEAVDSLDARAQVKTREQAQRADLILDVQDGTQPQEPGHAFPAAEETTRIQVLTRRDREDFRGASLEGFAVANPTGEGLPELVAALEMRLFGTPENRKASEADAAEVFLTTERQRDALQQSRDRLRAALNCLDTAPAIEIIAFEARAAVTALRELLGEVSADDVLHRLFAGFCIGK
jgi:tRNA modification GTPase TrmE